MAHSDDSTTIIVKIVVQSAQYVAAGDIYVNQQERLSGGIELGRAATMAATSNIGCAVRCSYKLYLHGAWAVQASLRCALLSKLSLHCHTGQLHTLDIAYFTEILTYQDVVRAVRDELKRTDLADSDNSISFGTIIANIAVQSARYVAAGDIYVNQQERLSDYESLKSSGIRLQRTTDENMTLNVESAKYVAGGNIHFNEGEGQTDGESSQSDETISSQDT
ncbi:hypothetical protein RRG08_012813 [Elysia crispata]|uniref:Uncharacterized protein n=1 Tax=Elysia crispata TaxID=231223 RepID=A0AAE0XZN9_9GAST|nr:hypothetical protein RRG08_012813 [Elysia crispata]